MTVQSSETQHLEEGVWWETVPGYRVLLVVLACAALFHVGGLLSGFFSSAYRSLPRIDQIRWNLRLIAFIHALISTVIGLYVFHFEPLLWEDPVDGWSDLCWWISPVTCGYMFFDLVLVLWNFKIVLDNPMIVAHHIYILAGSLLFWAQAPLAWGYCCNLMVTELSTLFLHINAFFLMTESPKGKLYVTNGLALFFAFTHRLAVSAYLVYWLYSVRHEVMAVSPFVFYFYFTGSVLLGLLNLYWYWEIFYRVLQHFFPSLLTRQKTKLL